MFFTGCSGRQQRLTEEKLVSVLYQRDQEGGERRIHSSLGDGDLVQGDCKHRDISTLCDRQGALQSTSKPHEEYEGNNDGGEPGALVKAERGGIPLAHRHRYREGQQERRLGSLPVHDERRAAGNPGLFGVTGVGVCTGNSPSLCSLICITQLFDASLLCPRHLTLDKPFCSVGEHGEEESGHFQMNFVIPMSVR